MTRLALPGALLITWVSVQMSFFQENFPDLPGGGGPGRETLSMP